MNHDAILQVFEPAARIYCAKVGTDPNKMHSMPNELVLGTHTLVPQWHFVALELHDLSCKITALREAGGQKPPASH